MKKYFYSLFGLFLSLISMSMSAARAENSGYDVRLDSAEAAKQLALNGRVTAPAKGAAAIVRGGGSIFVTEKSGVGSYYVKFELREPEKFEYHRAFIGLFVKDPQNPKSDGYYLFWDPAGIISCYVMLDEKMTMLNQFIHGGKDNPNRYKAGDIIELTLEVPPKVDGVWLWCHSAKASGEPTTGFKLTGDLPRQGHFGAYNAKWYSNMVIYELKYSPASEK